MKLELRGITKRFGPLVANDHIDLTFEAGEIHALLGENGAGKSTLMNVLYGLYDPDGGEILVDDAPVRFTGPGEAMAAGIGMVHQHFMLIPVFTVAENVVLGHEPTKGGAGIIDLAEARRLVREISDRFGFDVDPDALVEDLPVGVQQRVEIIKVLFRSANAIIFDEPTAVLTPQEVTEFFAIVKSLRSAGKAIVFITHKLHEILEVADRISVLREGRIVGEGMPGKTTDLELAEMMVGRPVSFKVDKKPFSPGPVLLDVQHLTVLRENDAVAVNDLTLNVRAGEIVGIAGVQGNGQSELVEALAGVRRVAGGSVTFQGKDINAASARDRHRLGMAHIPEDRQRTGIIAAFTVAENMVLDTYYDSRFSRGLAMDWQAVNQNSAAAAAAFDVRTPSIFEKAGHLSGGNQQKLVVARELNRDTKLLIASQPTRGLDVGSIEYIHKRIVDAREEGDGILIVSSELDEIMSLCDRILVMFKGRIVAEFGAAGRPANKNDIGLAMAGVAA